MNVLLVTIYVMSMLTVVTLMAASRVSASLVTQEMGSRALVSNFMTHFSLCIYLLLESRENSITS